MSNLIKVEELKLVKPTRAAEIIKSFEPLALELSEYEELYNEILFDSDIEITKELSEKAKRLRLDIGKIRTRTGKVKDDEKKLLKQEDKAIMKVHNFIVDNISEREDQLKKIETHLELIRQQKLEALQIERAERLSPYVEDAHERPLKNFSDSEFEDLLAVKKKQHEDKIEAATIAENARIAKEKADKEERDRIQKENEKLRAERLKAEQIHNEEKKKREVLEAKLKVKEDAEKEAKRIEEAKKRELEKLEEEKKQAELNKGDAEKVHDLVNELEAIRDKYTFESDKNKKMFSDVTVLINKVINHINL